MENNLIKDQLNVTDHEKFYGNVCSKLNKLIDKEIVHTKHYNNQIYFNKIIDDTDELSRILNSFKIPNFIHSNTKFDFKQSRTLHQNTPSINLKEIRIKELVIDNYKHTTANSSFSSIQSDKIYPNKCTKKRLSKKEILFRTMY